jgi:hypothetical protein
LGNRTFKIAESGYFLAYNIDELTDQYTRLTGISIDNAKQEYVHALRSDDGRRFYMIGLRFDEHGNPHLLSSISFIDGKMHEIREHDDADFQTKPLRLEHRLKFLIDDHEWSSQEKSEYIEFLNSIEVSRSTPGVSYFIGYTRNSNTVDVFKWGQINPITQIPLTMDVNGYTCRIRNVFDTESHLIVEYNSTDFKQVYLYSINQGNPSQFNKWLTLNLPDMILPESYSRFDVSEIDYTGKTIVVNISRDPPFLSYDYIYDIDDCSWIKWGAPLWTYYQANPLPF